MFLLIYWCQFLEEPNKANRNVKAINTVLTSVFRPLSGIDIQHLQNMANVQLLVRPRPHIWAWSYQLALATALCCPGGYNQCLWSSALQLSPIAHSLWYMSLCPAAVTILSQQAFEAMLATPGKRTRVEQSVRLQLNHWDVSAECDSLQLSPLKPVSCLLIGKSRGSCQSELVSKGLNQKGISVVVSTGL